MLRRAFISERRVVREDQQDNAGDEGDTGEDFDTDEDEDSDEEGAEDEKAGLSTTALVTAIGSRAAVNVVLQAPSLDRAAAQIAKSIPEAFEGQHAEGLRAMLSGDTEEAKVAAFRMLVYQVSNNLIDYDDDQDNDDKYVRIVELFRDIGLPRDTWEEYFANKHDRSSKAFAEKLFEAAVNARDLEIVEALLRSGIDPNQPIMSYMSGRFERPIQVAAHNHISNTEVARLLAKAGADVDLMTPDNPAPAIHKSAQRGKLEMVQLLVESGADIYRGYWEDCYAWESSRTPLGYAADTRHFADGNRYSRSASRTEDGGDNSETESESVKILRYLAGLHQQGGLPARDKPLIQDALIIAAGRADPSLVDILRQAGGDVTKANRKGITPLMVAASHYSGDTRVASCLLDLGVPINEKSPLPSALHFAATKGRRNMVALLIKNGADVNTRAYIERTLYRDLLGEHFNPPAQRATQWYTPLQLALHKVEESQPSIFASIKSDEAAIALLEAGAELVGGELVQGVRFLSRRLVGALLDRGADPNETDSSGRTALQVALQSYQLRGREGERISDILIDAGANVLADDIHLAFGAGDVRLARLLFGKTSFTKEYDPDGKSLLEAALCSQSQPLIDWALSCIRIVYSSGALCARIVFQTRSPGHGKSVMDRILEKRKTTGIIRDPILEATAVSMAAFYSSGKRPITLRKLLGLGHQGNTCVIPYQHEYQSYITIIHRYWLEAVLEKYREPGWWRKPDLIRCSPLAPVLLKQNPGRRAVVRMLLKAGYRPDPLALLMAIWRSTAAEVEELLLYKTIGLVNTPARYDLDTPLQLAVRRGDTEIVRLLLKHGANANGLPAVLVPMFTPGGDPNESRPRSALQMAVEKGNLELIDILMRAGADVNGPMSLDGGASALQCAAAKGFIGIAKTLIEKGADVNARRAERHGRTALEAAAEWGRLDMVQFLLESGAETESEEGLWQYLRAIGFAKQNGHWIVAGLLREWRVLDKWERGCLRYYCLLDEVFVIPHDALDELYGGFDEPDSEFNGDVDGEGSDDNNVSNNVVDEGSNDVDT